MSDGDLTWVDADEVVIHGDDLAELRAIVEAARAWAEARTARQDADLVAQQAWEVGASPSALAAVDAALEAARESYADALEALIAAARPTTKTEETP